MITRDAEADGSPLVPFEEFMTNDVMTQRENRNINETMKDASRSLGLGVALMISLTVGAFIPTMKGGLGANDLSLFLTTGCWLGSFGVVTAWPKSVARPSICIHLVRSIGCAVPIMASVVWPAR